MNILIICLTLSLVQLIIQYWLKNDTKDLQYSNLQDVSFNIESAHIEYGIDKEILTDDNTKSDASNNDFIMLHKTLKHLEFISEFEMYLETKSYKNFPIELVKELEHIKLKTQMSVLKSTADLNNDFSQAA